MSVLWSEVIGHPFGRAEAQTFLNEILPAAPDIPIQIAHLGGSGRVWLRARRKG